MPKRISSIKPREDFRKARRQQENSKRWYTSMFARLVIMAVLICIAVNIRIYYNQRAELLNREIARVESQIHELDREIENLKKRKEELTSFANICKRNNTDRIGLQYAQPSQIRNIVLYRRSFGSGKVISSVPAQKRAPQTAAVR